MLITATDFDFDQIPYNIPDHKTDAAVVTEEFSQYVDDKIEWILKKILGIGLYDDFVADLAEDYPAQKFLDLRNGKNYSISDVEYEWVGMVKLLTPFIYAMWLRDTYDNHSKNGIVVAKNENSEFVSPSLRIVLAWNKFAAMLGTDCSSKNTLYGFLKLNYEDDYSNWVFDNPGTMNRFNL